MEVREILVANTRTQKRSKITTAATTLGELKTALAEAGVDYSGMTFTEGISKTQLLDDATQLPQNVMYKGQPTNNLVILLTNTKKNIASGIGSRADAYVAIKELHLQDAIKEIFGRNYTQIPTSDLWIVINDNGDDTADEDEEEDDYEDSENDIAEENASYTLEDFLTDNALNTVEETLAAHIAMLAEKEALDVSDLNELKADIDTIIRLLEQEEAKAEPSEPVSTSDGSINDDDIDDMVKELNM